MSAPADAARPRPRVTPDNQPFWDACRRHVLLLPVCTACDRPHLPPGPVCPFCLSFSLEWRPAKGTGSIASWVRVHKAWFPAFARKVPYHVALIELDEGPRITATIEGDEGIAVGARVRVTFEDVDEDLSLPVFKVARGGADKTP